MTTTAESQTDTTQTETQTETQTQASDKTTIKQESAWYDSLSDEIKGSDSFEGLKKFKDVEGLVGSYIHAEKRMGSAINIPDKEDSDGWDGLYEKLGRPAKPEEYDFTGIENAKDLDPNDPIVGKFSEWAHKRGLNNRQAAGIVNEFVAFNRQMSDKMEAQFALDENELKQEFGTHYEERTTLANDTLKKFVDRSGGNWERVSSALAASGLANQPDLVRALSSMGMMMKQDKLWGSGGEPSMVGGQTVAEIEAERDAIKKEFMTDIMNGTPLGREKQRILDEKFDQIIKMKKAQS